MGRTGHQLVCSEGEHVSSLSPEVRTCRPHTCGAHIYPRQDGLYMLPYCQQFCNAFPASSPSVWQRAWAAWRMLSPTSLARIRRLLQTACRTPRRLSVRRPLLYGTRTHPPTQHSAARTWWTPRSVSLLDDHTCPRRQPPHVLAKAVVCLGASDCFAVIVLEHKSGCMWLAYLWGRVPPSCG